MGRKDAFRGVKDDLWQQIAVTFNAERAEKDKVRLGHNQGCFRSGNYQVHLAGSRYLMKGESFTTKNT